MSELAQINSFELRSDKYTKLMAHKNFTVSGLMYSSFSHNCVFFSKGNSILPRTANLSEIPQIHGSLR